jgi:hypothetical protein
MHGNIKVMQTLLENNQTWYLKVIHLIDHILGYDCGLLTH